MADRIRQRQPLLPALVKHVEERYAALRDLLEAAREVPLGEQFLHGSRSYQRTNSRHDRRWADDPHVPSVRVIEESGQVRNLGLEEDSAFWEWAYVEAPAAGRIRPPASTNTPASDARCSR